MWETAFMFSTFPHLFLFFIKRFKPSQPAIRGFPTIYYSEVRKRRQHSPTRALKHRGAARHTPRSDILVKVYSITPKQYDWPVVSIAQRRTAIFLATATIAFFLLPEFLHTF